MEDKRHSYSSGSSYRSIATSARCGVFPELRWKAKDSFGSYLRKTATLGALAGAAFLILPAWGQRIPGSPVTGAVRSDYVLSRHTIGGGGLMFSIRSDYELSGTIGQADAGAMAGGEYTLTGGFWFPVVRGDADGDGGITLHDYERFEECLSGDGGVPPDDCAMLDSDDDGDVDLLDFAQFQRRFSG